MSFRKSVVSNYTSALTKLLTEEMAADLDVNVECMAELLNLLKADDNASPSMIQVFRAADLYDEMFDAVKSTLKNLPEVFRNLIDIMHENQRLGFFPQVIEKAYETCLIAQGIRRVEVVSAQEIKSKELADLKTKLEELFSRKLLIDWRQDSELVAGFTLKIGSCLIDASLRSRLQRVRNAITGEAYA
ncbi:MAG: ATP synthase F1 subunit delta [Holosporales bacterium]|jgi:F-type H+-transporting ATPase subunit delta|nr:ATP synthase F1 subunit delta [Holosporales bacterium]